ncbi:unknown [Sinorhizobium phage PBC5]|nr:unknown [Sinorhizobium phage PBC5]
MSHEALGAQVVLEVRFEQQPRRRDPHEAIDHRREQIPRVGRVGDDRIDDQLLKHRVSQRVGAGLDVSAMDAERTETLDPADKPAIGAARFGKGPDAGQVRFQRQRRLIRRQVFVFLPAGEVGMLPHSGSLTARCREYLHHHVDAVLKQHVVEEAAKRADGTVQRTGVPQLDDGGPVAVMRGVVKLGRNFRLDGEGRSALVIHHGTAAA